MVKVESLTLVAAALASLCDVQGMQLEPAAKRPNSWIQHQTLSGKPVEEAQIEVRRHVHMTFIISMYMMYDCSLHLLFLVFIAYIVPFSYLLL
jgi:hypothetical protein